jgi:RecB family exonuclease
MLLSSSSIKTFKDCRMAYRYGYELGLEPTGTEKAVVSFGTAFHQAIAAVARGANEYECADPDVGATVAAYLKHKPLPADILAVEDGFWFTHDDHPDVSIRCTFDLVYRREDGTIVVRDYKTFSKSPTLDLDLDYQGRFYLAAAMRHYGTKQVEFEYEYVRQSLTHVNGSPWFVDEMYLTYPLVISDQEAETMWRETGFVVEDILTTRRRGSWYRSDKKGFGGCPSCFYKNICKAENQLGRLDEQTLAILSTPRAPLVKE